MTVSPDEARPVTRGGEPPELLGTDWHKLFTVERAKQGFRVVGGAVIGTVDSRRQAPIRIMSEDNRGTPAPVSRQRMYKDSVFATNKAAVGNKTSASASLLSVARGSTHILLATYRLRGVEVAELKLEHIGRGSLCVSSGCGERAPSETVSQEGNRDADTWRTPKPCRGHAKNCPDP